MRAMHSHRHKHRRTRCRRPPDSCWLAARVRLLVSTTSPSSLCAVSTQIASDSFSLSQPALVDRCLCVERGNYSVIPFVGRAINYVSSGSTTIVMRPVRPSGVMGQCSEYAKSQPSGIVGGGGSVVGMAKTAERLTGSPRFIDNAGRCD